MDTSSSDHFYSALLPFSSFSEFADLDAYTPVPEDWVVMITDVRGSTKAIADGRYKDVNMVGAASITAVLNVCGDIEIPFVFGGDGATLLVPASLRQPASDALLRLQASSDAMFGLPLRVGAIPVSDLRRLGTDIRIRKYELSPRNFLAMLSGSGVERADALLKDKADDNPYTLQAAGDIPPPDLEGLSCRWEPLVPEQGCMMNLMIQPLTAATETESTVLARILQDISGILGHGLEASAPANRFSLRFRWPPSGLRMEARATENGRGYWRHYLGLVLQTLVQAWCERFDKKAGPYDAPAYREELRANTDFRKFDGMLRTVLDVTREQAAAIEAYLQAEYDKQRLIYGVHITDSALMTCLVFSLDQGEHVHFIDGANGGFAMAAVGFKQRVRSLA